MYELLTFVLKYIDINYRFEYDKPAICLASRGGYLEMVRLFIEKGANIESDGFNGETPIYDAIMYKHVDVVKLLVVKGAEVYTFSGSGDPPLAFVYIEDECSAELHSILCPVYNKQRIFEEQRHQTYTNESPRSDSDN